MPKIGVHIVATNEDGQVLLVRKNYLDKDWTPPGGVMEDFESIPDAAKRECLEETGYVVDVGELIAVGSRPKTNDVIFVIEGKILEKRDIKIDPDEISEIGFFSLDSLPSPIKPEVHRLLILYTQGVRGKILVI
jgi:ADP-ribose pyrophosphatase YjhB (NUDIX family)